MAAGLTKKQINSRIYTRLKRLQHKLLLAGVHCIYQNYQLAADVTGLETVHDGFNIRFGVSRASNGEVAGFVYATVYTLDTTERYGWLQPAGDFDKGIARIVELFSRLSPAERPSLKF